MFIGPTRSYSVRSKPAPVYVGRTVVLSVADYALHSFISFDSGSLGNYGYIIFITLSFIILSAVLVCGYGKPFLLVYHIIMEDCKTCGPTGPTRSIFLRCRTGRTEVLWDR
ncbi:3088_t:CDS:2 [Funneliformis caledonium]|uniref:3088_t:CDS:1 n=1 Tax=Funneliformis caledonium TaxID=1117310 RepID=A0A9N8W4G4_9GLOM|nr:3088_t:CDS:2 [Funneliformis caledonium]